MGRLQAENNLLQRIDFETLESTIHAWHTTKETPLAEMTAEQGS